MTQDEFTDLSVRVSAFKADPEKYRVATQFVDQLIQQAKKEADSRQKEKDRSKFVSINVYLCP